MFKWEDYLELAKFVFNQRNKKLSHIFEACLRSAISRAYYATYGEASEFIESIRGSRFYTHYETIMWFKNNTGNNVLCQIGDTLVSLKQLRKNADYHRQPSLRDEFKVANAIISADAIIKNLKSLHP